MSRATRLRLQHSQRGSLSVLSVVWLAFTVCGVGVITHATSVVQHRTFAQESADSIALAGAIGGVSVARQLEALLGVTITQLKVEPDHVIVEVRTGEYLATSEATSGR